MGIKILLAGPEALLPQKSELNENCKLSTLAEASKASDVLMFLRVQHERHQMFELDTSRYNEDFGLNDQILSLMKEKAIIMHPGPVNRGVEISDHLVEHSRSRIFKQMENGVYTRMAILDWLFNNQEANT